MRKFQYMIAVLLLSLSFCSVVSAEVSTVVRPINEKVSRLAFQNKYTEARLISLAANTCAGTYADGGKASEYTYLGEYGWEIKPYVVNDGNVEATFMIAVNKETTGKNEIGIIAFRGSKSKKDWEVNLNTSKVEFGGSNLQEFAKYAERKNVGSDIPQVHQGFNEYVMTAFSLKEDVDGDNIPDDLADKLRANPNFTLLITGHSLGGAAASLLAERLVSMGVPKEQVPVVTFGAPAVGNKAFIEQYGDKINLTRVVTSLDPVPGSLQSFFSGYTQFKTVKTLNVSAQYAAFQHPISLYFDLAMKNFYDVRDEGIAAGYLKAAPSEIRTGKEPLVAVIVAESDKKIDPSFAPYIRKFVINEYKNMLPRYVVIEKNFKDYHNEEYSVQNMIADAKAEGADYLIILEAEMQRMGQTDRWYSTLNQGIFKTSNGRLVALNSTATMVAEDQGAIQSIVKNMEKCRSVLKEKLDFIRIDKPLIW